MLGWSAMLPGVGLWDTAEFQVVGPVLGTAHPTGFPAYVLLAWLASVVLQPLGEPAFRVNVLSAILVAVAAGAAAALASLLSGYALVGLAAGIVLATTPLVWALATHADPHAFHLAVAGLLLLAMVVWQRRVDREEAAGVARTRRTDRLLLAAAAIFGAGLAGHLLIVLFAPGIALFVRAVDPGSIRRPRFMRRCVLVAAATAGVLYLELPLRALSGAPLVYGHPGSPVGFADVAFGLQFAGTVGLAFLDLGGKTAHLVGLAGDQLGLLAPLLPVALAATIARQPRFALLTIPAFALTCWFAASYENASIERYYAGPALIAFGWLGVLAGLALDAVRSGLQRLRVRSGAASLLPLAALTGSMAGLVVATVPARHATVDMRSETRPARWLDATLAALPPRAVVVSWWDYSTTLWYGQLVEGRRRDVWVVDDRTRLDLGLGDVSTVIDSQLGRRPVYLIRLPDELPPLAARFELQPVPTVPWVAPMQRVVADRFALAGRP